MSFLQALLLGILQGVAEFLPISSSGHLSIAKELFGLADVPLVFDVMLHLATLAAVCLFFWKQIWDLLKVFWRWLTRQADEEDRPQLETILAIVLGTIVTGVIGVVTSKMIPDLSAKWVCGGFVVTAVLLLSSGWYGKWRQEHTGTDSYVPPLKGLFIGLMQGIGTLPGISRSGSTIAASLFAGIDRSTAGEFSFILSIPAVLGAFILEAKDLGGVTESIGVFPIIVGMIAAFVSGIFALKVLMKLIKNGSFRHFAWYLLAVAVAGFIFL